MSKRKFYVTKFTVTVLSEQPIGDCLELRTIDSLITEGDCSGAVEQHQSKVVGGKKMAALLLEQQSDPGFFGLTEDGKDTNAP